MQMCVEYSRVVKVAGGVPSMPAPCLHECSMSAAPSMDVSMACWRLLAEASPLESLHSGPQRLPATLGKRMRHVSFTCRPSANMRIICENIKCPVSVLSPCSSVQVLVGCALFGTAGRPTAGAGPGLQAVERPRELLPAGLRQSAGARGSP
jgi:hypothetical protein